jgi:hypothetical protein
MCFSRSTYIMVLGIWMSSIPIHLSRRLCSPGISRTGKGINSAAFAPVAAWVNNHREPLPLALFFINVDHLVNVIQCDIENNQTHRPNAGDSRVTLQCNVYSYAEDESRFRAVVSFKRIYYPITVMSVMIFASQNERNLHWV